MGKRIIITEEEKKQIKEMHSLNEDWIYDLLSYLGKKGKQAAKKVWSKITGSDKEDISKEDLEKMSPEERAAFEKEMEDDKKSEENKKSEVKKSKEGKKETQKTGSWVVEGRYCYRIPSGYKGGGEAHLLICGLDTSPTNLSKSSKKYTANIPNINKVIFVMTDYKNTVSTAKSWISKNLNASVSSVAGFSKGGEDAWPLVGSLQYKLIGLIDPTTTNSYSYEKVFNKFGENTFLVCDPTNWGGYKGIQKNLQEYCDNKEQSRGRITCEKSGHHQQLGIFYEKYSTRL
jgi:hypothetical protein